MSFFESIFARRAKTAAAAAAKAKTHRSEYISLLRLVADGKALSSKQSERLECLLILLGLSLETGQSHAVALKQVRQLEPVAAGTDARRAELHKRSEQIQLEIVAAKAKHEKLRLDAQFAVLQLGEDAGQLNTRQAAIDAALAASALLALDWQSRLAPERTRLQLAEAAGVQIEALKGGNAFLYGSASTVAATVTATTTPPPPFVTVAVSTPVKTGPRFGEMEDPELAR